MIEGKSSFAARGDKEENLELTVEKDGEKTSRRESFRHRRNTLETVVGDLGASGLIAIAIIFTACTISVIQVARGSDIELPRFLYEFSLLIIGYYFGQKVHGKDREERDQGIGFRKQ